MKLSVYSLIVVMVFTLSACRYPVAERPKQKPLHEVSIMTFNVENLFDTQHDVGKNDYTYLPSSAKDSAEHRARCHKVSVKKWREQCLHWNWNERVLRYKLEQIALVIKQVNQGRGPDIIAFQEVENIGVLQRLQRDYLQASEYLEPVLIEGDDLRGIDVAFMSRLPLAASPKLHAIEFNNIEPRRKADTRGILQADFMLPDGDILTGYAVHFPAPFHPYTLRVDAYQSLNKLLSALPEDRLAFAAGDFNTPSEEDREHRLLETLVVPYWTVSHQVGCENCPGTHYYKPKKEWSFLDMILVKRGTAARPDNWQLDNDQTQLINQSRGQTDEAGFPREFSIAQPSGVSDHWPLMITLKKPR